MWTLELGPGEDDDYEYFITKARMAMEDNKVFQANRFIELAMKNAPAGDLKMLLDLKKKNDVRRIGITIKSLAVQSFRVFKQGIPARIGRVLT